MAGHVSPTEDDEIITRLLAHAHISADEADWRPMPREGAVNRHYVVVHPTRGRFVARLYGWPFRFSEDLDRRAKEAAMLPRLARQGVLCPDVVATTPRPGRGGSLLTFIEGELLGDIVPDLSPAETEEVWESVGRALRQLHHVPPTEHDAELLVMGGPTVRRASSWADWHATDVAHLLAAAVDSRLVGSSVVAAVIDICTAARPALRCVRPALLHADAHPWNVVVARDGHGRWEVQGWLDWEWAWIGDPDYDLMRLSAMRFQPIGATPASFFAGYGRHPGPLVTFYAVGFWLLCAVEGRGVDGLEPLVADAGRFLASLPRDRDRIVADLAASPCA